MEPVADRARKDRPDSRGSRGEARPRPVSPHNSRAAADRRARGRGRRHRQRRRRRSVRASPPFTRPVDGDQPVLRALAPAPPTLRRAKRSRASAVPSPEGRADHHAHCAVGGRPRLRRSRRARQVVGRLQTPSRSSAMRSRLAASRNADRSAARARTGLDDARGATPRPRPRFGLQAPVLGGLAVTQVPCQLVDPVGSLSSPRSTMRLNATRAVPSATPKSAHHSTKRPAGIRGGRIPSRRLPINDRARAADRGARARLRPRGRASILRSCFICRESVTSWW